MTKKMLDLRGLSCPLPALRAAKLLRQSLPGDEITILATDRVTVTDFPIFCRQAGHILLESSQTGDVLKFVLQCGCGKKILP